MDKKKANEKKEDDLIEKETKSLESRVEELEKEVSENLLGWQRAKADFINYKRDQEKCFVDFKNFACEDIILKLLPTIDSFELATKHMPEELKDSDWAKGMICIKGLFDNFLKEVDIKEIEALGKMFDPNLHEAVGEEVSDEEEDIIIEEIQKGYFLKDKIIRPTKVKISKGKNK